MSMALEVMKLMFAVLDVSFNSGHYTVIRQQFLFINMCTFATIFIYMLALVHDVVTKVSVGVKVKI